MTTVVSCVNGLLRFSNNDDTLLVSAVEIMAIAASDGGVIKIFYQGGEDLSINFVDATAAATALRDVDTTHAMLKIGTGAYVRAFYVNDIHRVGKTIVVSDVGQPGRNFNCDSADTAMRVVSAAVDLITGAVGEPAASTAVVDGCRECGWSAS